MPHDIVIIHGMGCPFAVSSLNFLDFLKVSFPSLSLYDLAS